MKFRIIMSIIVLVVIAVVWIFSGISKPNAVRPTQSDGHVQQQPSEQPPVSSPSTPPANPGNKTFNF